MDNASLINSIIAKWFPKKPKEEYVAEIDYSELIKGETSGTYKETQKNKPSPVSSFTYQNFLRMMSWGSLGNYGIVRSYCGWTNSMEPTMDHGDLIMRTSYEKYKKTVGELRLGQIAIYRYGKQRIIHRFIGKTPDGKFIFKGDNNFRADPPVEESQIEDVCIGILYTRDKILEGQD